VAGLPIKHGKGVKVRDLLSPLLFELAIDPLQQILDLDIHNELLHKIRGEKPSLEPRFMRMMRLFLFLLTRMLAKTSSIPSLASKKQPVLRQIFKKKNIVIPIRYQVVDLDVALLGFPVTHTSFPMKYLGLPLSV
jgi:hypothetical protein